jgi:DNA-directed RNA polymerase specialized sigma24 family protein
MVLSYWEQLTEAAAAAVLGWPEGTVKSATSCGLQLRELSVDRNDACHDWLCPS